MCYCDPKLRTPWCHSSMCQDRLKIYQTGSDVPAEYQGFLNEYDVLKYNADQANERLRIHVESCKHPSEYVEKVAGSNTGNWCESDDSYWYDCKCSLCNSRWTEEQ
jgi:hypothetical protein